MNQKEARRKAAKLKAPRPVELPSGAWRCQVMVKGKRISVVDDDPEIAHAKALALKNGLIEAEKKTDKITLRESVKKYIAERKNVLSPSTVAGYEEILKNRLQTIMDMNTSEITTSVLQSAVNEEALKVSNKTIRNALTLVVAALGDDADVNIKRIRLPQRNTEEHKVLDVKNIIDLFEHIEGNSAEVPVLLAVWLCLRRSEIMGLCWDCVDFEKNKITIRRAYVKGPDGYVLKDETKTSASRRVLDCPAYIMEKLGKLKPPAAAPKERVFKIHPNTIYQSMKRISERYGIDFVGVHGLRHTSASIMLSLGIIDKVAMARGGWSTDVTMKQIYQHVFQEDKDLAAQKIDEFFTQIASGINPYLHTDLHTKNEES